MPKAKYYIEVDDYYQNSQSVFIGPYATKEAAEKALDLDAGPVRADLGHGAQNVRFQSRCLGIWNTTQARARHMIVSDIIPAQASIPGTEAALDELWYEYNED